MNIRKMIISDYEEVYNIWINTKGVGVRNYDDSYEGILRYLKRNENSCFVAEEDKKIIGVILGGHDGRRGYIYHMAVSEVHRNRGIGRTLVNSVIEALNGEGIHKICLVAMSTNEVGNEFWEKLGFKERTDLIYRDKIINYEF